jgi:hypothetical protein
MYRYLVNIPCSFRDQPKVARRQERAAWIFIVLLGAVTVLALYLLCLKKAG